MIPFLVDFCTLMTRHVATLTVTIQGHIRTIYLKDTCMTRASTMPPEDDLAAVIMVERLMAMSEILVTAPTQLGTGTSTSVECLPPSENTISQSQCTIDATSVR